MTSIENWDYVIEHGIKAKEVMIENDVVRLHHYIRLWTDTGRNNFFAAIEMTSIGNRYPFTCCLIDFHFRKGRPCNSGEREEARTQVDAKYAEQTRMIDNARNAHIERQQQAISKASDCLSRLGTKL